MSRPKRMVILTMVMLLIAVLFSVPYWINQNVKNSRSGPLHTFSLSERPKFLSDVVALDKAKETLALDGYNLSVWQPLEDDRSKAPDGTSDHYLVRNTIDPNRGSMLFTDRSGKDPIPSRIVDVELKGNRLECQVIIPK